MPRAAVELPGPQEVLVQGARRVHDQTVDRWVTRVVDVGANIDVVHARQCRDARAVLLEDHVDAARLERRVTRGVVGNGLEVHSTQVGQPATGRVLAPVLRVLDELGFDAHLPRLHHEGTRTDRVTGVTGDHRRRVAHAADLTRGHELGEGREGRDHVVDDRVVVDLHARSDDRLDRESHRGVGVRVAPVRDHDVRIEWIAVGEVDTLAQPDGPGGVAGVRRCRQCQHPHPGVTVERRHPQAVVERIADTETRRVPLALGTVEDVVVGNVGNQSDRECATELRLGLADAYRCPRNTCQ